MPDPYSIPFKQAAGNGHYESKQLPDDNSDFLVVLGLPTSIGNVTSASASSLDGQLAAYWGTSGSVIKASALIGVVDLVDGKVTTRLSPTGDIVGTTGAQTLSSKTLTNCIITGATGISKTDVGLGNVDNTSDANKPVSGPQQTALNLKEDKANKGVASGYASLDATAKVPTSQLPAAVLGATSYQGTWNALSNNPVIPLASVSNKGWYYVVNVAGTTMVDGINDWAVKDWIISNGTTWDKCDNTDQVTSVAGRMGDVVLTKTDVGLANVDNTSDATKWSQAATLTNKTINGNSNSLVVRLDADVIGNLPIARLNNGSGATDVSFWRGDGQWASPAGGGNVVGPAVSIDGEIALFNGTSGTLLRRAGGTGLVTVVSGVFSPPTDPATIAPPTGSILDYAGATAPVGWLLCYGQAVSRTTYSVLFGVISTVYGAGDGSSTFNLPDFRGRMGIGKDDMGGTSAARLSVSKTGNTTNASSTIANITGAIPDLTVGMFVYGAGVPVGAKTTGFPTVSSVNISANATATATAVPLRFAYIDGLTLGTGGGEAGHTLSMYEMPAHTHSITAAYVSGGQVLNAGANYVAPANASLATVSNGYDTPHNNIPPVVVLNRIIKT